MNSLFSFPSFMARRPYTLALLLWLPAVKWFLAPGMARFTIFYAGGAALAVLAIAREGNRAREGDWARLRPLFSRPGRGLWEGLFLFGTLMATAALLLLFPPLQPWLPFWLYDGISLFDPIPVYVGYESGLLQVEFPLLLLTAVGAIAEEWIFRAVLLWRWILPPEDPGHGPNTGGGIWHVVPVLVKVLAVSLFFTLLHWPAPAMNLALALTGSLVLGTMLAWRKNLALVATLHVLFNWKTLVFV